MTEPGGIAYEAIPNQWWETKVGTMVVFADSPNAFFGLAEGTITSDDPDSPLGQVFGGQPQRPTSADGDKGITVDAFNFSFYPIGEWTKCVLNDVGECRNVSR